MKILHVITSLAPRAGGPTVVVKTMAREQARQGHEVVICTTNADHPNGELPVVADQAMLVNNVTEWYFSIDCLQSLCFSTSLARWIWKNIRRFDVVHVHGLYRFPPTYAAWQARLHGVPYLIRPHGNLDPFLHSQSRHCLSLKRIYERLFDVPNLNAASAVHFSNQEEADRASFIGLRSKSVIVPNGIDWKDYQRLPAKGAFRNRLSLKNHWPVVLFLGRIDMKKGLDLLIPSFKQVEKQYPEARLVIVGPDNDDHQGSVKRLAVEQCVDKKVIFVEHLAS